MKIYDYGTWLKFYVQNEYTLETKIFYASSKEFIENLNKEKNPGSLMAISLFKNGRCKHFNKWPKNIVDLINKYGKGIIKFEWSVSVVL